MRKPPASAFGRRDRHAAAPSVSGRHARPRLRARLPLAVVIALTMALVGAATTQAATGIVGSFPFTRTFSSALQPDVFAIPIAVGVNADGTGGASAGDIYIVDSGASRIQQFSTTDQFIRLWGAGVVKSGPGNADEKQAVRVEATGGSFKLGFGAATTADLAATATAPQVEAALNGLGTIGPGGVSVSGGPGDASGSTPYLVTFDGGSLAGTDQPLLKATNGSIPLSGGGATVTAYTINPGNIGYEVCQPNLGDECKAGGFALGVGGSISSSSDVAVDQDSGNIFVPEQGRMSEFSATGQFIRAWGEDVVAAGPGDSTSADEQQSLTIKATGGKFTLSLPVIFNPAPPITAPLPYNASASQVEAALNALSSISGRYGFVTVTGEGTTPNPYLITFHGTLGGDDVEELTASPIGLIGSEKAATVETVDDGGGYEICEAADSCKSGTDRGNNGSPDDLVPGEIGYNSQVGVAPDGAPNAGNVLVGDSTNRRVVEFTATGAFVRMFGFDVDATNPSTGFEVCTAASGNVCKRGTSGKGIGQFSNPNGNALQGIGVDSTGAIYTAEDNGGSASGVGMRVQKFTPAGGFDLTPSLFGSNEVQALTVNAGAGNFRLSYGAKVDGTKGTGTVTEGSTTITNVVTSEGEFAVGQPIDIGFPGGSNFPSGTTIVAVGPNTLTVSKPIGYSQIGRSLRSDSPYTTPDLAHDASPAEVKSALDALPSIGGLGGSVAVSGSPGDYLITFDGGTVERIDALSIRAVSGVPALSGGSGPGANTAVVATTTPGGPNGARSDPSTTLVSTANDNTPWDVAIGPDDHVFVGRYYPLAGTTCADGSPAPEEIRIMELDPSGTVLGVSDPCVGREVFTGNTYENLTVNPTTGRAYLLPDDGSNRVAVYGPVGPDPELDLDSVSSITPTGGTISGTVDPNGPGTAYPDVAGALSSYTTTYRIEYKKETESEWTKFSPDIPIGSGDGPLDFSVAVGGLAPKTPYEIKVVTVKPFTASVEGIESFTTAPAAPEIEALSSSNVTVNSADLQATINPQGTETTYHFEYGTTPAYGQSTPEADIGDSLEGQEVTQHIEGLEDTVYHFRVVATNALGTVTSENQTFTFHPPVCPNQTVRQQTGAAYLPDCRAYELVSPENAGGATLFSGGPQSPYATNPPRLTFAGQLAAIPNVGRTPINTAGDLYLATRGPEGWRTRYIGPSAEEAGCVGGRPLASGTGPPSTIHNDVMADPGLDRIVNWNLGNPMECVSGFLGGLRLDDLNTAARGSNAPYVWNANGELLDRWPTSVGDVPGATENFECPQDPSIHPYPPGTFGNIPVSYFCSTYIDASKDLRHFVFSTQSGLFGQGGLTEAPGSAYDNDTSDNTLNLVSELQNGKPIGQEPGAKAGPEELIQFPSISEDGSHILMGTAAKPACKQLDFPGGPSADELCAVITQPTHLYMRVNDAITYDVSGGKAVKYIDATPDGSKVYFTSEEQLTGDDDDESVDLFMWSENSGAPQLVRVSAGAPAPAGNADNCASSWTTGCDVGTYEDSRITSSSSNRGGMGNWDGNDSNPGYTDNAVAAQSGDIYFYSPEQLVEGKGVPGRQNLYVYREGALQLVAALEDEPYCLKDYVNKFFEDCSNGAVGRLQVTPDGRYAAFTTTTRITPYDNQGYGQMYRYDAEVEKIVCVSCRPDGEPPNDDVLGSQGGRFITDDGRVFFDTTEALDPRDTNAKIGMEERKEGSDVYEFVDGRAQLITPGTGTGSVAPFGLFGLTIPGLYGVSADGADVYFSTFDTLVGQDRNGSQVKFYDARTNGGFSFVPPPLPCAAADECRGPTSGAPAPLANGTGAALGASGNARTERQAKKRKAQKRKAQKRKRQRNRAARRHKGGQR